MEGTERLDRAARLLGERGRGIGRARIAADRGGVVLGFPRDPMVHVSWVAVAVLAGTAAAARRLHARRR